MICRFLDISDENTSTLANRCDILSNQFGDKMTLHNLDVAIALAVVMLGVSLFNYDFDPSRCDRSGYTRANAAEISGGFV